MELLQKRISSLLTVKSLVTIALTIVFAICTLRNQVDQQFMTIYTVIISFYFGTQAMKGGQE